MVNVETEKDFALALVKAFDSNKGLFSKKVNVENWVPQNAADLVKALFLFFVVQLDYATKSQKLYEGATSLLEKNPKFFDPNNILSLSDNELLEVCVKYLKPRYPNEASLRLKINAKKLINEYSGNPIEILDSSKNAKEALKRILEFRGYGPKTGNLFLRSMVSIFNTPFDDIEDILPPVDIHDVRIAYLLGFIDSTDMTEKNILRTKKLWNNVCKVAGVNWITFDRALWLLGSEGHPKSKQEIIKLLETAG